MNIPNEVNRLRLPMESFFLFVKERLEQGECVRISVKGCSMTPFLVGGRDKVELVKLPIGSLRKGMVVLAYLRENCYVLHRVVRVDNGVVLLRGDGNISGCEQCEKERIVAEAILFIRNGKEYACNDTVWRLACRLWPDKPFLRRVLLYLWRKIYFKTYQKYYGIERSY